MMITVVVCLLILETCGGTVAQRASPVWNSDVVLGIKSDESSAGTFSDEESFVLCAFVQPACSPLMYVFVKEEESCTWLCRVICRWTFCTFVRSVWIWLFFVKVLAAFRSLLRHF